MKNRVYSRNSSRNSRTRGSQIHTNHNQTITLRPASTKLPHIDSVGNDDSASSHVVPSRPACDITIGACSQQGKRPYQEDEYSVRLCLNQSSPSLYQPDKIPETHFFGLFDGHAGGRCSKYVSSCMANALAEDPLFLSNVPLALKRTFHTVNDQFLKVAERMKLHDGSTGICAVVRGSKLLVANVGDCRCLVVSSGQSIQMSIDQKPTNPEEQKRIASLGGTVVYCMGVARVNRILAVSRAFGNRTLRNVIKPDAEMMQRDLSKEDEYLVMASDGLWDVLKNRDVSDVCNSFSVTTNPQQIAEELVRLALARGSMDNVTCLVVRLVEYVKTLSGDKVPPSDLGIPAMSRSSNVSIETTEKRNGNTVAHSSLVSIAHAGKRRVVKSSNVDIDPSYSSVEGISKLSVTSNKQFSRSLGTLRSVGEFSESLSSASASISLSGNSNDLSKSHLIHRGSKLPNTLGLSSSHGEFSSSPAVKLFASNSSTEECGLKQTTDERHHLSSPSAVTGDSPNVNNIGTYSSNVSSARRNNA